MKKTLLIGVDLGGTNTKIALISKETNILGRSTFLTKAYTLKEDLIKKLINEVNGLLRSNGYSINNLTGIGIGLAGLVDYSKGFIFDLTNISGWRKVPLRSILESKLNVPVYLDNDANAICLGEYLYGAGKNSNNLVLVSLGTGIGAGIIINGRLYRGSSFSAGEIGHIIINENGPKCGCGSFGCLEAYIGNSAITRAANEGFKKKRSKILNRIIKGNIKNLTPQHLSLAAKEGDPLSIGIWKDAGRYLGIGLSALVNLLNPDKIVICGGISKAGDFLLAPAIKSLKKFSMDVPGKIVKVLRSKLGDDAGVIGAASLVRYGG
jgi:glucokinase